MYVGCPSFLKVAHIVQTTFCRVIGRSFSLALVQNAPLRVCFSPPSVSAELQKQMSSTDEDGVGGSQKAEMIHVSVTSLTGRNAFTVRYNCSVTEVSEDTGLPWVLSKTVLILFIIIVIML